jgi:hypothetical protein
MIVGDHMKQLPEPVWGLDLSRGCCGHPSLDRQSKIYLGARFMGTISGESPA